MLPLSTRVTRRSCPRLLLSLEFVKLGLEEPCVEWRNVLQQPKLRATPEFLRSTRPAADLRQRQPTLVDTQSLASRTLQEEYEGSLHEYQDKSLTLVSSRNTLSSGWGFRFRF